MMGLRLDVYRHRSEWPTDDVSAVVDHITVINVDGPFKPDDEAPAYMLLADDYYPKFPVLVPVIVGKTMHGMASGNFAGTSDGRWTDAVSAITGYSFSTLVAVHDRFETTKWSAA